VEVIRELWNAYGRGDFDHVLSLCDPHIVSLTLEEGPLYGSDAVRANYERWKDAWKQPEITVVEAFGKGTRCSSRLASEPAAVPAGPR
jgi:hypothetical protein